MNLGNSEHPLWYTIRFLGLTAAAAIVLSRTATSWDLDGEGIASLLIGGGGTSFLLIERYLRGKSG